MTPVPKSILNNDTLKKLSSSLLNDLEKHKIIKLINRGGERREESQYNLSKSKDLIDQIDLELAKHFDLSEEEIYFMINYDSQNRIMKN